jgi:hypothetical protein
MSNTQTLGLRTLDDEELLDVVGGCESPHRCQPQPCQRPCQPCGELEVIVVVCLPL